MVLLTMHHIVSDGWSMGVLLNEVTTLYAAFSRGEPSPLPEPVLQYADYAVWQRVAARRGAGETGILLAAAVGRRSGAAGVADRQATPCHPDLPWNE